jgi:hypothetical protein
LEVKLNSSCKLNGWEIKYNTCYKSQRAIIGEWDREFAEKYRGRTK